MFKQLFLGAIVALGIATAATITAAPANAQYYYGYHPYYHYHPYWGYRYYHPWGYHYYRRW